MGAVGGVAQGVDGLQAGAALQAATVVGEGVKGELAVVHPRPLDPAMHSTQRSQCCGW